MTIPSNSNVREPECLITGVTLCIPQEQSYLLKPADLFLLNGNFIINAAGEGETRESRPGEKIVLFEAQLFPTFERRNVYIIPAEADLLNEAALAYIERTRA